MNIAMIGLGKMGLNMVLRLLKGGHTVVATDRDPAQVERAREAGAVAAADLDAVVAALPSPRVVWVMVPSGAITQSVIDSLAAKLSPGDVIIDGGNSNWKDSQARGAALAAKGLGPFFYLPKLQSHREAALWEEVMAFAEVRLGLPIGTMKATVLIETLPAVFEMDEILHALRGRIVGLNCGRWDYIFSYLKTFRAHRDRVLPERTQIGMTVPFLKAYSEWLIRVCHRRGAFAMGGMAAQIPISRDAAANEVAMAKVRADKQREVAAGHDGTWVAHPGLIPIAQSIFDAGMPTPNQLHLGRDDVTVTRDVLITPSTGTITRTGFLNNIDVCVRYVAAWLDGLGCVPIHHLMEDAATAEISRAQLWQWLHVGGLNFDDGTPLDFAAFDAAIASIRERVDPSGLPGEQKFEEAVALLSAWTHADELVEFLTLPCYERLA